MAVRNDSSWAHQQINEPLTSPEAWQTTGPYQQRPSRSSAKAAQASSTTHRNPFHTSSSRPSAVANSNPFRDSSSSTSSKPENRRDHRDRPRRQRSHSASATPRPLDTIKRETRHANRAPHLRRSAIPGPDTIDRLGSMGGLAYHHEGPFDATLRARQIPGRSPVEAVKDSTAETLRATPRENIIDSLEKHVPLQGTAIFPPGVRMPNGRIMGEYEEYDLQRENGGNYRRWPGMEYSPDDLKGKGEPSYTIERLEKEKKHHQRHQRHEDQKGYELQQTQLKVPSSVTRVRSGSGSIRYQSVDVIEEDTATGSGFGAKLKKKLSLRRRG